MPNRSGLFTGAIVALLAVGSVLLLRSPAQDKSSGDKPKAATQCTIRMRRVNCVRWFGMASRCRWGRPPGCRRG
jgi:hypothetical protein